MYITKYLNTFQFDHVYFSMIRFYMCCLGISAMAVIMILFMRKMYQNKGKNMAILVGSFLFIVSALFLVQAQEPIGDVL
jgi:formate-dependent nitrite reductase membrane component NrfD